MQSSVYIRRTMRCDRAMLVYSNKQNVNTWIITTKGTINSFESVSFCRHLFSLRSLPSPVHHTLHEMRAETPSGMKHIKMHLAWINVCVWLGEWQRLNLPLHIISRCPSTTADKSLLFCLRVCVWVVPTYSHWKASERSKKTQVKKRSFRVYI